MKNHLIEIVDYNLWANQRIVTLLKQYNNDTIEQEIKNSFPSIKATLFHCWGAEAIWLKRLQGISLDYFPSSRFEGSLVEAYEEFLNSSLDFLNFTKDKEESFLLGDCHFDDTEGNSFSISVREIIHHVINHSTYHRGQIITMGKQLGFEKIESTDFITYVRLKGEK